MDRDGLRGRITDQFSNRDDRSDIWRAFAAVLDTGEFLNLGYSAWYQPHVVGSSQRRLADMVGKTLSSELPTTRGVGLLDVGCGRGGPTLHLRDRFGFRVTGIDLVPYNVERAVANARARTIPAQFVVGDATMLPFEAGSFVACTAIDSIVYIAERDAAFEAIADVLEPGGVFVCSDLVTDGDVDAREDHFVSAFADAWDMSPPGTVEAYERAMSAVDLRLTARVDISSHSVGRFRTWSGPFLGLVDSPLGGRIERLLRRAGLDPVTIIDQVRRAHYALPSLRHVLFVATAEGSST